MMLACLVGLVALRFMPETAGRSLREDPFARSAGPHDDLQRSGRKGP
jgi:MHS family proline/betaine transporter-like MFS transporter